MKSLFRLASGWQFNLLRIILYGRNLDTREKTFEPPARLHETNESFIRCNTWTCTIIQVYTEHNDSVCVISLSILVYKFYVLESRQGATGAGRSSLHKIANFQRALRGYNMYQREREFLGRFAVNQQIDVVKDI